MIVFRMLIIKTSAFRCVLLFSESGNSVMREAFPVEPDDKSTRVRFLWLLFDNKSSLC